MDESNSPAPAAPEPDPDPEIEALLHFTPVHRRTKRHDGWPAEAQRDFIAALARLGNYEKAAHALNRSGSGAWKVRKSGDGEEFSAAWDGAMALYQSRNPKRLRPLPSPDDRFERRRRRGSSRWQEEEPEPLDPEEAERRKAAIFERIIHKYRIKTAEERKARLAGDVVAADFCVRQLTFMEVLLDLGGQGLAADDVLGTLRDLAPEGLSTVSVAATPMSVYLDGVRRDIWRERGEPERPPLGELGHIRDGVATGPPHWHNSARDGPYKEWSHRQEQAKALAAKAQAAWEEKAKADAEEWARREAPGDLSDRASEREGGAGGA